MKCSNCGHNIVEKAAKFCSQCGQKLPAQPANTQDTKNHQPAPEDGTDKSASQNNLPTQGGGDTEKSKQQPKRETRRKKNKRSRKGGTQKEKQGNNTSSDVEHNVSDLSHVQGNQGNEAPDASLRSEKQDSVSSDGEQHNSELSLMVESQGKEAQDASLGSEGLETAVDKAPDCLAVGSPSEKSESSSFAADKLAPLSGDTQVDQGEKTTAKSEPSSARPEEGSGSNAEDVNGAEKQADDQTSKEQSADTQCSISEDSKPMASQEKGSDDISTPKATGGITKTSGITAETTVDQSGKPMGSQENGSGDISTQKGTRGITKTSGTMGETAVDQSGKPMASQEEGSGDISTQKGTRGITKTSGTMGETAVDQSGKPMASQEEGSGDISTPKATGGITKTSGTMAETAVDQSGKPMSSQEEGSGDISTQKATGGITKTTGTMAETAVDQSGKPMASQEKRSGDISTQKTTSRKTKNTTSTDTNAETAVDQSGNMDQNQNPTKSNAQKENGLHKKAEQQMVFGPYSSSKVKVNEMHSKPVASQEEGAEDLSTQKATSGNVADESGNMDQNQNPTKPASQKAKGQHKKAEQKNGPNPSTKTAPTSSSVDPAAADAEPKDNQKSETAKNSDVAVKSDHGKGSQGSSKEGSESKTSGPPPRRTVGTRNIAPNNRLTIYFHAVLSKHFKFDPEVDQVVVRVGSSIGTWESNAAELTVTRDLEEHGYLVEGCLMTNRDDAVSVSIPYKYAIYKKKKEQVEYEFIYKVDSEEVTNRCLFVKSHLISEDGDWHQYDDIICAEPSKSVFKRIKEKFWPEQRSTLVQGRDIAGAFMLDTIFNLLESWSDKNLSNFLIQLDQFFQVYGNPFVYEGKQKKWTSLNYDESNVKSLLKDFMVKNVTPQLSKDGNNKRRLVQDPLRAAVIMLYVWDHFKIKLDHGELHRLCTELCLPKQDRESFLQYWKDFSQDVAPLKKLTDMLVSLIITVKEAVMPRWILVLPMLHLLKTTVKPFEVSTSENAKFDVQWAGLQGLKIGEYQKCMMNSQDRTALMKMMKSYNYLIDIDALLARSCLYLLTIDDLVEFSLSVNLQLLDTLHVFASKTVQDISYTNYETVSRIISHIQQNIMAEKYSYISQSYWRECVGTAVKLLDKICRGVKPSSHTPGWGIPGECMKLVASVSDFVVSSGGQETHGKRQFAKDLLMSEAMPIMRQWTSSFCTRSLNSPTEIEIWDNMLSIAFKDEDCTQVWRKTFTVDFEGRFKRETAFDQVEFYCTKIEALQVTNPHIASCIERCALEAVTSLCQTNTEGKLLERVKINWKFGKLISTIIQKSWPRDHQGNYQEDKHGVLQHLLSWPAAKDIFALYGAETKLIEKLSEDARDRLAIGISAFTAIRDQLVIGNIEIGLLCIILKKESAFLELLNIDCLSENEKYKDKDNMCKLLKHRQDEVNAVYHEKELVHVFLTMSHKLEEYMQVSVADMDSKQQVDVETMQLDRFMEVHPFEEPPCPMAGVVTFFSLDEEIRRMSEVLHAFRDSYIFKLCWERQAKLWASAEENANNPAENKAADVIVTPDVLHDEIFEPCIAFYKDIYTCLRNGSIRLKEVNQLFRDYKNKYRELAQDLVIMCRIDESSDKQWIDTRVQQIEQYHELHLAVESAQVILTVKETLGLQGDFRVLETLREVDQAAFQNEQLNRIDNDLMQAKRVLLDITEPRRLCLEQLGLRRHFVKWVKDALEDINELKVFVDLATISAGENAMDVDRVACFHDAVLGFSSMLYDLKPDSGFNALKEVLQKLWKALENDRNLPKKLRDTARHLEWLKTVKDSHGSVELSSLSLASAINNKGIYLIGANPAKKLSLETVLELHIPEEHDDRTQMRRYSLDDLRDLQNKLMLMSGKGDQGQMEVDNFAEVFAGVQRLAEAFIAIHNAGNPLFRGWGAKISCCSTSKKLSIEMDFKLKGNLDPVTLHGCAEKHLLEVCRRTEKCLDFWMDFVDKQRSQHYYLNYYTAEQIVYLCGQLSQQNLTHIEDQALMMLSFIRPNCTASDLRQAWHELQYEIITKPREQNEDIELQTFIVLPAVEPKDRDRSWESRSPPDRDDLADGLRRFDATWNAYMEDMERFLPNLLDMNNLGRLLDILASKGESGDIFENNPGLFTIRELPKGLVLGSPNLIVCPHKEVLISSISIYMTSKNEKLPSYDEVLLCNSSTTYEEVELFLRRCLSVGYKGQKIYSLLYGDLLTYEVSAKFESFYQRMKMQSQKNYRLVIICSSEREHSYLPSAFSQNRLHMVPQEPLAKIQRYLHQHYVVPEGHCSAAAVFKDRLSVGVVSSKRAGVGKSLFIKRLYEKLKHSTRNPSTMKTIRLIEPKVDENAILQSLLSIPEKDQLIVLHFDVTSSVEKGIHEYLFKLLILRYMMDSEGKMWNCSNKHLYVVEFLESTVKPTKNASQQPQTAVGSFIDVFPSIFCQPPKEVLMLEMRKQENPHMVSADDPLTDDGEFRSEVFQRPYQYLARFHNRRNLDEFVYEKAAGTPVECLQMFLMYCGMLDPSWAELRNFARFLNFQLKDCENSVFCNAAFTGDTLAGFKTFVVDFMIQMAKDFASPSLSISDQSPGRSRVDLTGVKDEDLAPFLIRKRWETQPHPYIFFNSDHVSMTFIGFHLKLNEQNVVDAIEPVSGKVIRKNIMTRELYEGLKLQRVPFNVDFDSLPRGKKIEHVCSVLGVQWPLDPDETYELTTDNILKMLAIHMRFRCGIPVIIMGETGCGKTRLIRFLCQLHRSGAPSENMILVKVHGGTTSEMIYTKVKEAEQIASVNKREHGFDSVLFFDEANTTEDISSIKEVLCDKTVRGESLTPNCGLQIIAACNPYRKHTGEMIKRLESAGLGYRVRAEETNEKLGSIPLRQLVYRVQALPPSMIPLVWDFGQLNDSTEIIYIQQIARRVVDGKGIDPSYTKLITDVLSASQKYMRKREDECSFVSLRDVERCMQAFVWFHDSHRLFFEELEKYVDGENAEAPEWRRKQAQARNPVLWSLVMAIGVCYHACLEKKDKYRQKVCRALPPEYSPAKILQEITLMQDFLLSGVPMGDTIARNSALKENVFMMVLCIELRIPLFLVGKPGSSKSLSKTLVADAMQGQAAHSNLYKMFKQIHMVSFQCSPHSTPEGIINTFKQCGRFQEGKNLNEYISVVVLDEIGLAEDSAKMPLKTLHPLLEEGCIDDEPLPHKKVGFIGISNWALDPAKMNRGIFVSRGDPDEGELIESAKGICSSDAMVLEMVRDFFKPFARAYLSICRKQGKGFFGLRDYYSLVKMIFAAARASQRKPTPEEVVKAVLRNFSGGDDVDVVSVFTKRLQMEPNLHDISAIEFVGENIKAVGQDEECRYLLLLTNNYAALQILQQTFFSESGQPEIIFGSSFPKDQEYTQICRNINRVKICMETGQTVVLLNLQNLYESLYDALNQYYVYLGGQKYVDLGLGTHRVKCRVHRDFRLIVIEEREVVYKQFPIPLINRLEKHYLDIHTVLKSEQRTIVDELEKWVRLFMCVSGQHTAIVQSNKYKPPDVFIGYHSDTCASVVLQVIEMQKERLEISDPSRVLSEAKLILLKCATPDSVVRLDYTSLPKVESEHLSKVYFEEQCNNSFVDYIVAHIHQEVRCLSRFTEVTTFSRLLTSSDLKPLEQKVHSIVLLSLQQFDTETSFLKKIRNFLTAGSRSSDSTPSNKILIIQCDFNENSHSVNLIASAKYSSINEINKVNHLSAGSKVFVYFITRLPRMEGGTSYVSSHGGCWRSVHIDDLRQSQDIISDIKILQNMTISQMFQVNGSPTEAAKEDGDTVNGNEEESGQNVAKRVLDTTALVRSCVQSAVGMLRDQGDNAFRGTQRVENLLTLLSDDDEIKGEFLQTVMRRLHLLLAAYDSSSFSSIKSNWVIKEASNIDALQEGGTFRQTLWKRVQAVVVPVLAQIVSVIDRDQNLDVLLDGTCDASVKRLWLDIFGNEKLLDIPYLTVGHQSESRTILVQNYISQDRNMSCCMPFSWKIKDFLESLWVCALQQEQEFDQLFWKTPLGQYIAKAEPEKQTQFFDRYLQDFVSMTMNVTCQEDLQLLCRALRCCVNELRFEVTAIRTVISLPWVHTAYHQFKKRLQNLSRMTRIEPRVTLDLLKNSSCRNGVEMVLDAYAAFACVEYLEPRELDTDAQRQAWLRQVKKLQVPIALTCSEDAARPYKARTKGIVRRVQSAWNRIFSLSLFVEHLFEEIPRELTPLVLEHVRQLGKVLERNSDLKTQHSFEAVIHLLKKCKDTAVDKIFRFGLTLCPVCMGDPQDPLSLPCHHIYCVACIKQWLVDGQMYCPLCMEPVPDGFQLVPSEEIRFQVDQHTHFRKQCNAFFVDLVSSVCFKDNSPPCSAVVLHLLSFLLVEGGTALIPQVNRQILTKMFSPFDDAVDKNPVVRSVVLKLLLKYSFDEVKGYLQQYLLAVEKNKILEETDKTKLYSLYLNCLEDSMFERVQFRSAADRERCLRHESVFLTEHLQSQTVESATVEYLQLVARLRMDLDLAATLIAENPECKETGRSASPAFMASVENLCKHSGNNWYRVYLIRKISSQHGVKFVLNLLKLDSMHWLFPEEILQKREEAATIDPYLVYGEKYKTIRNAVADATLKDRVDGLHEIFEPNDNSSQRTTVCLLLALFREFTTLYRDAGFNPKAEQLQALVSFIQSSKVLAGQEVKAFAEDLVTNRLGPLTVLPGTPGGHAALTEQAVHLTAVLLCTDQEIVAPLRGLAMSPGSMQAAFLPTMPEDMFAVAQQALGQLQWYYCQNGHPCTVGECGQPMQTSHCLDCGVQIGGSNHIPTHGFHAAELPGDRTRSGHVLGDPGRRDNPDTLDTKSLSPVAFTLVRMLTHLAMLLGARNQPQSISSIIKPPVQDPVAFLLAHLQKDMELLIRSLGKGTDDTVSAVHLLIRSLLEPHQPWRWPVRYDKTLSTKEARNEWELEISGSIVSPQQKHLDRRLGEVNAFIRSDSRVSSDPIMKLLFGNPAVFLASLPQNSLIHSSAVWSCREKMSLLKLSHIVEQNDGKNTLPVLWRFLHREAELRLVRHLPDILALQRELVKKFQNVADISCGTIAEFLHSQKTASLRAWYEDHIKIFLTSWNQLRVSLATNGEIKIPAEVCQRDLDFNSDLEVLLPRRQGPGLCSTALVGFLVGLHNDLIYCVDKHTGEETSYKVSPADLVDLHVIRYELERDLMPLVLSNAQYSIKRGRETVQEYDLPKIQKQIVSRFLLGKPLITLNGIPTLVSRHEPNYETILKDVKSKVEQEPLQTLTVLGVVGELHSYSEVCEALSTLEVALRFLAMTGADPLMKLSGYLEEVLQMGNQMAPHILKALSTCCLKHCVALWQLLASLKSEKMLRLKRDPFLDVSESYKRPLGEDQDRLLSAFFSKSSADAFLLEMHEFLLLVLKKPNAPDTYKPEWSLKDVLVAYAERKELDVHPDVEKCFPDKIDLSQSVEAWKFIVGFKQDQRRDNKSTYAESHYAKERQK